ncbi:FAD synthase-like isoform X2 [Oscarella lobularis]|uniref:FAD synthase-like isoform X2 n=1 Tax=Oscarella lobularis TaxID=121494 RepID=UPI0033130ACD
MALHRSASLVGVEANDKTSMPRIGEEFGYIVQRNATSDCNTIDVAPFEDSLTPGTCSDEYQGELNGEGVSVAGVDNVFVSGLGGRCESSKDESVDEKECRFELFLQLETSTVSELLAKIASSDCTLECGGSVSDNQKECRVLGKSKSLGVLKEKLTKAICAFPKSVSHVLVDVRRKETSDYCSIAEAVYSTASVDCHIGKILRRTLGIIEKAFDTYKSKHLCLSFNGGKDCTVLAYLLYAVYYRKRHLLTSKWNKPLVFSVVTLNPFQEAEEFVEESRDRYDFHLIRKKGPIKAALEELKKTHPHIEAILIGNRRGDPYSDHLLPFILTDSDWPMYMRVCPILDWSYEDVWSVIQHFDIPYCSLYDKGYTSLGSRHNTVPNVALMSPASGNYRPAFDLTDSGLERTGRK